MPNALVLKTFAWDEKERNFFSPSRSNFVWKKDIVVAQCEKCAIEGDIGDNCTCGLYGSPNWQCLEEYHKFPNSIIALMNTYGKIDIWTGPPNLKQYFVTRSLGMQVLNVIKPEYNRDKNNIKQRFQVAILGAEYFDVDIISLSLAEEMIKITWGKENININPFLEKEVLCQKERQEIQYQQI